MPRSEGYRCNTRSLFSQPFRKSGPVKLSTYLVNYHIGDYVDIRANSSIHKGMPHKYYHGKTGVVWNVTPRAVGVEVNKRVGNRIMKKRIHVRIEHIQKSKCRLDFLKRVKENEKIKAHARLDKTKAIVKREPGLPRHGMIVVVEGKIETVKPTPYEFMV